MAKQQQPNSNNGEHALAIDRLRAVLGTQGKDEVLQTIIEHRDSCLSRYKPIFALGQIPRLTEDQFKSFLLFENNNHWTGLNRKGHRGCEDMKALRKALGLLLDEGKPLPERMNKVADEVPGMGKALLTAIMLVAYPDKYGVWNGTSEEALKALKIWPTFERGLTFGDRYVLVNQVLNGLAHDLNVDLWTLDALFWRILPDQPDPGPDIPMPPETNGDQRFGLERHLHEFLRDNWARTALAKEWGLYAEQGDSEAGYEYPTDIGRIDLLAKHLRKPRWLVVELKRAQTCDDTVGQVLRYMGWVRKHLAQPRDEVEGLIIAHDPDERLRYAIAETPKIRLLLYEVSFSLRADSGQ